MFLFRSDHLTLYRHGQRPFSSPHINSIKQPSNTTVSVAGSTKIWLNDKTFTPDVCRIVLGLEFAQTRKISSKNIFRRLVASGVAKRNPEIFAIFQSICIADIVDSR